MTDEKQFKEWDRKLRRYRGAQKLTNQAQLEAADTIKGWPHIVRGWAQSRVQYAVYEGQGHEAWQMFRVGLHGLPTKHKLYRLLEYKVYHPSLMDEIRVDNYIGALVRGGQLSQDLQVIK